MYARTLALALTVAVCSAAANTNAEFLRTWLVCGDFPNPPHAGQVEYDHTPPCVGLETDYLSGEAGIRPQPGQTHPRPDETTATWTPHELSGDFLDFADILGKRPTDNRVAYAYTTVNADEGGTTILALGSDDGIRVYLNGEQVHENLVGPLPLKTRWFNTDLEECTKPTEPGRYMAYLEGATTNGIPVRRALTFYCRPENWHPWTSRVLIPVPHPTASGIEADVWEEQSEAIATYTGQLFMNSLFPRDSTPPCGWPPSPRPSPACCSPSSLTREGSESTTRSATTCRTSPRPANRRVLLNRGSYGDLEFFSPNTFDQLMPRPLDQFYPEITDVEWGIGLTWMRQPVPDSAETYLSANTIGHGAASSAILRVDMDNQVVISQTRNDAGKNYGKHLEQFIKLIHESLRTESVD